MRHMRWRCTFIILLTLKRILLHAISLFQARTRCRGVLCCDGCAAFYRRNINNTDICILDGTCSITVLTRKRCIPCRLSKCRRVGCCESHFVDLILLTVLSTYHTVVWYGLPKSSRFQSDTAVDSSSGETVDSLQNNSATSTVFFVMSTEIIRNMGRACCVPQFVVR